MKKQTKATILICLLFLSFGFVKKSKAIMTNDDKHVYCGKNIISDLDPDNTIIFGDAVYENIYAKDNKSVYYCDSNNSYPKKIDGADPATFEIVTNFSSEIDGLGAYVKDKNMVYNISCYFIGRGDKWCDLLLKTSIDPISVKPLNNSTLVKDKNYVYIKSFNRIQGADPDSFIVLNNEFAMDKNNLYSLKLCINNYKYEKPVFGGYSNCNYQIEGMDINSLAMLSSFYGKDNNNFYYLKCEDYKNCNISPIENVDKKSFEVFKEDNEYAMDKTNMYFKGKILSKQSLNITNNSLYNSLKGKIILKTESKGEAYYINPNKKEMYSLSRPVIAFRVMREQGVGITNANLEKIPVGGNCPSYNQNCDIQSSNNSKFATSQKGKIFLQVEGSGEAWFINPNNAKRYFLGRPTDAFNIMKTLGLGISNANFDRMIK